MHSGPSPSPALLLAPLFLLLSHFPRRGKAEGRGGGERKKKEEKGIFFLQVYVNGSRIRGPFLGFSFLCLFSSGFQGWLLVLSCSDSEVCSRQIFLFLFGLHSFSFFQSEAFWVFFFRGVVCHSFSWTWLSWAFL